MIRVRGLTKRFGEITAVQDLSFEVGPGAVTGFLGPNGAGKTTTMRMILGLVAPSSGSATVNGVRYAELPGGNRKGGKGRDHLRVYARMGGYPDSRVAEVLQLVGATSYAHRKARELSTGMRQRLNLATALLGDPQVLLLDEPSNGLDPEGIAWLRRFLRKLAGDGRTVLVSSHVLSEAEQMVDRVVIIRDGRLVTTGEIAELTGESSLEQTFLTLTGGRP
jgi:ABC-2 type transport system ATP-binding protein